MDYLHSLIWGLVVAFVIGTIGYSVTSCQQQDVALRETCMRSGGTVINNGEKFHCIRGAVIGTKEGTQ